MKRKKYNNKINNKNNKKTLVFINFLRIINFVPGKT